MKKKYVVLITICLVVILSAIVGYEFTFNAAHRDISNEAITTTISAGELQSSFIENETLATSKYLDKVIATSGIINHINGADITLSQHVRVTLQTTESTELQIGDFITVKGRCIGFDELLEMVKIDQAILINN